MSMILILVLYQGYQNRIQKNSMLMKIRRMKFPLPLLIFFKRMPKRSWVWNHFKPIMTNKEHAFYVLCSENNFYGASRSTGMLECHIQRRHPKVHSDMLKARMQEKLMKIGNGEDGATELTQSSMSGFVVPCPTFESCLLKWMIQTYQTLRCCESDKFRMMCKALNKRTPIIGAIDSTGCSKCSII
jgi:hypothetical protein